MKKRWRTAPLALVLAVGVTGCGFIGGDDDESIRRSADDRGEELDGRSETDSTETALPPAETVRVGKTAFHGDFEIEVEEATFTPFAAADAGDLVVAMRLTNLSDVALNPDWQSWTLSVGGADLVVESALADLVPPGGSNDLEVGWTVDEDFSFDGAALVFGLVGTNRTRVPLGDGEVDGPEPFAAPASGRLAVPSLTVTVDGVRVSPSYAPDQEGRYLVRLPVTLDAAPSPGGILVVTDMFTLTTPDGDSVVATSLLSNHTVFCCEALGDNPFDTVLGFEVDTPLDGRYTLGFSNGAGEEGSFTFSVAAPA